MARLLPLMMPSEAPTNDLDWTRLQGTALEGGYQLESILAADESEASFRVRVLGDSAANAFAKVFIREASDFKEQVSAWERARQIKSRHLSTPLGAGEIAVEETTLTYVVLKRPDERLDAAIQERALSREEAGDVLLAAVRGLDELHSNGLVHGSVSPEQVVADGDTIQLSTERVRRTGVPPAPPLAGARYRAPESGAANVTPEADVWCLGATLVEVLTQRRCEEDCMDAAAKLPPPFDTIARGCLDADPAARIKLGQVEALFRGRSAPVPVSQPTAARPVVAATAAPARQMALPRRPDEPHEAKLRAWWLYAVAGVAVVLLAIWLFHPRRAQAPQRSQIAARTGTTPSQTPASAWESKTLTPEDAKTASRAQPPLAQPAAAQPAAALPRSPSPESGLVKGDVWRLVLYAYARQAEADSKVRSVNTKYPGLNAETFSPSGGSPYLVVAGGRMSREDALKLKQKARSLGLPRDAYIQNYQQ